MMDFCFIFSNLVNPLLGNIVFLGSFSKSKLRRPYGLLPFLVFHSCGLHSVKLQNGCAEVGPLGGIKNVDV